MTLALHEPASVQIVPTMQDQAIQRLSDWAQSAQAAYEVATRLVQTSFCPEAFRNKPGEATAAILSGLEVGLQPMAALRAFDVIQGQAAPKAITLRAVVQSHGHDIELTESTTARCKMRGRRRGASQWQEVVWTIDRARQLGVTNKPNWKNQPQTMLVARATSEIARLVAADAILGIPYSSEELADGVTADAAPVAEGNVAPIGTKRISRAKPEPVAPAEMVEEPAPETLPIDTGEVITPAQLRKLHACLNDIGMGDREDGLGFIGSRVGRTVESSKDLTKDEASAVIDHIETMLAPDPDAAPGEFPDGGAA